MITIQLAHVESCGYSGNAPRLRSVWSGEEMRLEDGSFKSKLFSRLEARSACPGEYEDPDRTARNVGEGKEVTEVEEEFEPEQEKFGSRAVQYAGKSAARKMGKRKMRRIRNGKSARRKSVRTQREVLCNEARDLGAQRERHRQVFAVAGFPSPAE
jgi:hypothetical protein